MEKEELRKIFTDVQLNLLEHFKVKVLDDITEYSSDLKLNLIDIEGYKYYLSFNNLRTSKRRNNNLRKFFGGNIHTIYNIKNYIKLNKLEVELLTNNIEGLGARDKLKWKCLKHNEVFERSWNVLQHSKVFCKQCDLDFKRKNRGLELNYIKKIGFDKYGIKIISETYENTVTPLQFICPKHEDKGIQENTWVGITKNSEACRYCSKDKTFKKVTKSQEQFEKEVKEIHGDKYKIVSEYKGSNKKIDVYCNKCKKVFSIKATHLLQGHGCGKCIKSKGEQLIEKILINKNIKYIREYRFDDCIGIKRHLPFDFYLTEYNTCIEMQGIQHYKPVELFGGEKQFEIQQINDNIKRNYCKINNIHLIEIPYWIKDIETFLMNKIKEFKEGDLL